MRFRQAPMRQSILQTQVDGIPVLVRADLLGDSHNDSVWGMFYSIIKEDMVNTLPDYARLPG
jgi:hypothetical protein